MSLDIAVGTADLLLPGAGAKPVPVALKTRFVSNALGVQLDDLSANVAGSAVRGRLGIVYGEPLAIDGELRTDRIDIGAVLATAIGGTALRQRRQAVERDAVCAARAAEACPAG